MRIATKAGMEWYALVDRRTSAGPSIGAHTLNREWQERNAVLGTQPGAK